MKTKTYFTKKLTAYTGAAGAFLAMGVASEAMAQAVYTDINPDEVLDPFNNDTFAIDFNNDAANEFEISSSYLFFSSTSYSYTYTYSYRYAGISKMDNNFGIIGEDPWEVTALNNGNIISDLSIYNTLSVHWNLGENDWGQFQGQGDKYIGVHFDIGTDVHYGWILVNIEAGCYSLTIKGFAYESQPEVGIMAGDTVGTYMNLSGISDIQPTSAIVGYWPSKTGTAYYVVQMATDPAPDKDEVKAGTGAAGATLVTAGSAATIENISSAFSISGLNEGTQYSVYSVIESSTILSNVKSIDFTTILTSIEESFSGVFGAFPSPTEDVINVQTPVKGKVNIVDISGKVIDNIESTAGTHQIDISELGSGMYFIHYTDMHGNSQVVKFVKK